MAVARGEIASGHGWWFRFADDDLAKPPEIWGEALRLVALRLKRSIAVEGLNLKTGEKRLFPSTIAAAEAVGTNPSQVSEVAYGRDYSANGWWFKFEGDNRNPPEIYGQKAGRLIRDKKVYARNLTTGECREFRNCTVADTDLNLHMGAAAAVSAGSRSSAGGWWFSLDEDAVAPRIYGPELVAKARSKAVIAIEVSTGKETRFDSAKAAAETLSMSRSSISFVISGKLHIVKGYKFRFDT
jgi:hypothetical protein